MKTAELIGMQLNLQVARADPMCTGLTFEPRGDHFVGLGDVDGRADVCAFIHGGNILAEMRLRKLYGAECYAPSSNWQQGGPIIEREQSGFDFDGLAWIAWSKRTDVADNTMSGPTPLVAAMRAFVASKYGDTVPDA